MARETDLKDWRCPECAAPGAGLVDRFTWRDPRKYTLPKNDLFVTCERGHQTEVTAADRLYCNVGDDFSAWTFTHERVPDWAPLR